MILNESEGYRYELFVINELDEVAMMMAEAFTIHEPMTSALGITSKEYVDFIRLLGPKMVDEELTVIARNQETNQIVGAMITDDFAIEPPAEIRRLGDQFKPVWAILDDLDIRYKQGRILAKGEYLHFFLLAVDHLQTGKNLAVKLVQACLENGIRKGYKSGIVEATGIVSQHIFRKFGFGQCFEIPYQTFMFEGTRVFESIKDHHGVILMDKALV